MEYDIKIDDFGTIYYYKKGTKTYHREDGPAIEYLTGYKQWWVNGNLHRLNGPAAEQPGVYQSWYINGKRHRKNAPAVEHANGYKEWWIDGKQLSPEKELILNRWWDNNNSIQRKAST